MWNFQIEIYCIPVHPRNHSRTGNHVISSSVSTACSLCFQNTSEQLSGMISYSWPAGISLVACCAIFLFSVGLERRKSKEAG